MDIFDREQVLKSMVVLADTREQNTARADRRYKSMGVPVERAVLDYGDYTYNATLPNGNALYDASGRIYPVVSIERKESLDEIAQCFTRARERFQREFKRAAEHNARIYLICENASWESLLGGQYRSRFHPNAFIASVTAYMVRYNMNLLFCKEDTSGQLIKEILYRDLKERLERGEFDKMWMDKTAPEVS